MKYPVRMILALPLILLLLGGCSQAPVEIPEYTIEQFMDTTTLGGLALSANTDRILVSSDESGVFNILEIMLEDGSTRPLTTSQANSIFVASCFPEGKRFIYSSDSGGDELSHLFVQEEDGTVTDLTPGENHQANFVDWAADDGSFFVSVNDRDPRFFDLYEFTTDGYAKEKIYQDDQGYQLEGISPDKRFLVFGQAHTTADQDLYLHDRQSGEMTLFTEHEGEVAHEFADFSPDGQTLLYLSDDGGEFKHLRIMDLQSRQSRELLRYDWDILGAFYSKSGRYLLVRVNEDARTVIHVLNAEDLQPLDLPPLPDGTIDGLRMSADESLLAFYLGSGSSPRDLYVLDLESRKLRRLTHSLTDQIQQEHLVDGANVRFESFDGLEIPGILYKPHGADSEHKAPALVWVHGGPGGQSRFGYRALLQYLVNHGYVVYAINNRGSSGYGKTFFGLDDRRHGQDDLQDCIESRKMLIDTGYVDPERIGIIGGSYGGYMVLAALCFTPDAFEVGVDIFGVSNWVRTLESIPPYWESFRNALYKEMGDPSVDGEYLHRISPLFHASNIRKPLMVLQGANDPRVLQVESDEIVAAVREQGVPVEYLVFEDEGHGFQKKENRVEGNAAVLKFLQEHL